MNDNYNSKSNIDKSINNNNDNNNNNILVNNVFPHYVCTYLS